MSVGDGALAYLNDGEVIRHNMGWTFIMLIWLIVTGVAFYPFAPTTQILV